MLLRSGKKTATQKNSTFSRIADAVSERERSRERERERERKRQVEI